MKLLIPKDYNKIASTEDQYKKVTCSALLNSKLGKIILLVEDELSEEEKLFGPVDFRAIEPIINVLNDVLWKAKK